MKIEITVTTTGPQIDVDEGFLLADDTTQQNLVADAISMLHGLALDLETQEPA